MPGMTFRLFNSKNLQYHGYILYITYKIRTTPRGKIANKTDTYLISASGEALLKLPTKKESGDNRILTCVVKDGTGKVVLQKKVTNTFSRLQKIEFNVVPQPLSPTIHHVSVTSEDSSKPVKVQTVNVRVSNAEKRVYSGYSVSVEFMLKRKDGTSEQHKETADVADDGKATLRMPENTNLEDDVRMIVRDSFGIIVREMPVEQETLKNGIDIDVIPDPLIKIGRLGKANLPRKKRVAGLVINQAESKPVANAQVSVYGQQEGKPEALLFTTRTDMRGYFSAPRPAGPFLRAYGKVGNNETPIPVPLESHEMPEKIMLLGRFGNVKVCPQAEGIPHAPGNDDLVASDGTYSSDANLSRCIDFRDKPDRTLQEARYYAVVRVTQPEVKKGYLDHQAISTSPVRSPSSVGSDITMNVIWAKSRPQLNESNAIRWDADDGPHQATTIAIGHVICFKQSWHADGYSLGDLLYSVPLAPCQKKQIAIIDWDRKDTGARSEMTQQLETLDASLQRDRSISENVSSVLDEFGEGHSRSSTSAGSVSAGLFGLGGFLGVSGGTSASKSDAWQNSSRSMGAEFDNALRDKTMQEQAALRQLRSTVIQTVGQHEQVRAETDVIVNHNHCHTLTIQYFQVLRHFVVRQSVDSVRECLFIPLLMHRFDDTRVLRWKDILQRALLKSQFLNGFKALDYLKNNAGLSDDERNSERGEKEMRLITGFITIEFRIARPSDKKEENDVNSFDYTKWALLDKFAVGIAWFEFWKLYIKGKSAEEKERNFQEQVAPLVAERIVQKLTMNLADVDATLLDKYEFGKPLRVKINWISKGKRNTMQAVRIISSVNESLSANSKIIVRYADLFYYFYDDHVRHNLFCGSVNDDLYVLNKFDMVTIDTPPSFFEMQRPYLEAIERKNALIQHLNENSEYYHHAIWRNMSPARRFMLLDGFAAPNAAGMSVASVVENKIIGIEGNSLVMPVAPGVKLLKNFAVETRDPQEDELTYEEALLGHYAPEKPSEMRFTVPTKGVFAEGIQGYCNTCEKKDDTRFWKWDEAPCGDEPTAIQPVSTESRRADMTNLTPTPFAAPIVNLQNAPQAPDPTGLSAALQMMSNPNLFRDMTGLQGTQQNAASALQSAFNNAGSAGLKAAELAQMKLKADLMPSKMNEIKKAYEDGALTEDEYKEMSKATLESGAAGSAEQKGGGVPDAVLRQGQSNNVNYSATTSDGTVEYKSEPVGKAEGETDATGATDVLISMPDHIIKGDSKFIFKSSSSDSQILMYDSVKKLPNNRVGLELKVVPANNYTLTLETPSLYSNVTIFKDEPGANLANPGFNPITTLTNFIKDVIKSVGKVELVDSIDAYFHPEPEESETPVVEDDSDNV